MSDMQKKLARGDEIEISLKDMFWSVLGHWRGILICLMMFALLLGGYKGLASFRKMRNTEANQAARESYQEAMASYESSRDAILSRMETLQREMESQAQYSENSALFAIDPYNTYVSQADFYVSLRDGDLSQALITGSELINAYSRIALLTDVSEVLASGMQEEGFIRVARGLSDGDVSVQAGNSARVVGAFDGNVFTVRAIGASQEDAAAILAAAEDRMTAATAELSGSLAPHKLVKLSEHQSQCVEQTLITLHDSVKNRSASLTDTLTKAQAEMDKLSEPSLSVTTMGSVVKQTMKYGVVGAFVGLFLGICLYAVLFVLKNTVAGPDELRSRYGGEILGAVPGPKKRGKLDRLVLRHKGVSGTHDEKLHYLAENLRGEADDPARLLLVSDLGSELTAKLAEELKPYWEGVSLTTAGDICEDADAARAFHAAEKLVFVTQLDRSRHTEIRRGLEKALDAGKQILGFVVLSD